MDEDVTKEQDSVPGNGDKINTNKEVVTTGITTGDPSEVAVVADTQVVNANTKVGTQLGDQIVITAKIEPKAPDTKTADVAKKSADPHSAGTNGETPVSDSNPNAPLIPGPQPGIAPEKAANNAGGLGQGGSAKDDNNDYSKYTRGDKLENFVILDIFFLDTNYIIFSSADAPGGLRYYYNTDEQGKSLQKIQGSLSKLIASLDIVGEKAKYQYNIASVYALCFNGDTDGALALINLIFEKSTLNEKTRTMGKINYLGYCLGIALAGVIVCVIAQYQLYHAYSAALFYFKIAALGSIGGFISIAIKVSRADVNFDQNIQLQILSAVSREFIGIFSALAIYLFIKSGLVIGVLSTVGNVYLFYAFAVLAGFSETFVPDFFGVIEKKTITGQTQQKNN